MKLKALRDSSELLQRITNTELAFFESISKEIHIAGGETLFEEGGPADAFYIISEGKIGLEMTSPGRTPMVIQTLGPGDLVGVSWFFPPHKWNWRARALVDSKLAAFDAVEVRKQCAVNRDLLLEVQGVVAEEVAGRLQRTRVQLLDLYRNT
jgi:CRP-like cAMP-binding protein